MKDIKINLTKAELGLLDYLLDRHIEGKSYFGNKKQHYKMCDKLVEKINKALYG